jgi:hypothetical protein
VLQVLQGLQAAVEAAEAEQPAQQVLMVQREQPDLLVLKDLQEPQASCQAQQVQTQM